MQDELLTPREVKMCKLYSQGLSKREVALRMRLTLGQLKQQMLSLQTRLGCRDELELGVKLSNHNQLNI